MFLMTDLMMRLPSKLIRLASNKVMKVYYFFKKSYQGVLYIPLSTFDWSSDSHAICNL